MGAAFTGIYATRLMRLVFYGEMSDFAQASTCTRATARRHGRCSAGGGAGGRGGAVGFLSVGFGATDFFGDFLAQTAPTIEATAPRRTS